MAKLVQNSTMHHQASSSIVAKKNGTYSWMVGWQQWKDAEVRCVSSKGNAAVVGATNADTSRAPVFSLQNILILD